MQAFWRGTRACELRANSRPLAPQCARLGGGDAFGVPSCRQGACVGLGPPSRHVNTSQTRTHDTRPHLKAVTTPPHAPRRPRPRARGQQGAGTGGGEASVAGTLPRLGALQGSLALTVCQARGATGRGRKKKAKQKLARGGTFLHQMRCVARTLAPCLSRGTAVGAYVRLGARAPLQSTTRPGRVGARALACRFARSCAGGGLWRRQRSAVAAAGGVSARSAGLCRRAARGEASAGGSVRQHTYIHAYGDLLHEAVAAGPHAHPRAARRRRARRRRARPRARARACAREGSCAHACRHRCRARDAAQGARRLHRGPRGSAACCHRARVLFCRSRCCCRARDGGRRRARGRAAFAAALCQVSGPSGGSRVARGP